MAKQSDIWEAMGYTVLVGVLIAGIVRAALSVSSRELGYLVAEYGTLSIISSLPTVILVWRIREFLRFPTKFTKIEHDEGLAPGEYILVDTRPHRMYFIKLYSAIMLNAMLVFYLALISVSIDSIDFGAMVRFLGISLSLTLLIYGLSANALRANRYAFLMEKAWAISFAVLWSSLLVSDLKEAFESTYPTQLWERLLGIPSIAMILFGIILFISSSIFWKVETAMSVRDRGPLGAISITLMAGGIASLFPPAWVLFSSQARVVFFWMFFISSVALLAFMLVFVANRGGMEFMVTNRRIISVRDFLIKEVREYPYTSLISTEVIQGVLGRRYGYGDLRLRLRAGDGSIVSLTLHGITNPHLARNTLLCLSAPVAEGGRTDGDTPKKDSVFPQKLSGFMGLY